MKVKGSELLSLQTMAEREGFESLVTNFVAEFG